MADAGDYECVAENEVGRKSATVNLRVIERPIITLEPDTSMLRLTEGDELRVTCMASGSPNPSVQWENEHSLHTESVDRHYGDNTAYLNVYRVTQADARVYTCVATNEAGRDERQIRVDVQPKRGDITER